jgi:L-lactate dehydrogenase (cytochrome)
MNMRLIGARTIDELTPDMVDASAIHSHVGFTPPDNLYNSICEPRCFNIAPIFVNRVPLEDQPLALAQFKNKL